MRQKPSGGGTAQPGKARAASPYERPTVWPPVHHRRMLRGDRPVASGSVNSALRS
jgi:hypothetical protein